MPIKAENRYYDRNQENRSKRVQSSRRHVMAARQITRGQREQPKEMRRRDRRNVQPLSCSATQTMGGQWPGWVLMLMIAMNLRRNRSIPIRTWLWKSPHKATYLLKLQCAMTRRLVIRKQLHDVAMTLTRCALQRSLTLHILQTCVRMTLEKLPNHSYVPSYGC